MDLKEKFRGIADSHQKLLMEYEEAVKEYCSSDTVNENISLKNTIEKYKFHIKDLEQNYRRAEEENQRLRFALKEQILDEKLNILKISSKKIETYFERESSKYNNSLTEAEERAKKELDRLIALAASSMTANRGKFVEKLKELTAEMHETINTQRQMYDSEKKIILDDLKARMDSFASEEISEELMQKRIRQNEIELKIGLNWVNKIGILLILLGVGAAAKYTYTTWFNDYMKGIFFFLLGGLLLAGGEFFYRKTRGVFATGLLGGGISVLYGAIFYSYFLLKIISMNTGLLLSVLVTLLAVALSVRYHSRTVCSLGLAGGYLPFFSYVIAFSLKGNDFYAAMGYLFLLNLSVLLVSLWKRWAVVSCISFVLNVPSLLYLVYNAPGVNLCILYSAVTFSMYLLITLAYPFKHKIALQVQDIVLLGLNTFISCLVIYGLFEKAGMTMYRGLLALLFCLVYAALGYYVGKMNREEKGTVILFYATSLTFAVLMVPFQFGIKWMSMGWLLEGTILIICGLKNKLKNMELSGWGIFILCLAAFYLHDFVASVASPGQIKYFDLRYLSVIAGLLAVMFTYLTSAEKGSVPKYGPQWEGIRFLKYFTLANLWIYLLYTGTRLYDLWMPFDSHKDFYKLILVAFISVGLGYALPKIPILYDRVVKYFGVALYLLGDIICLYITMFITILKPVYAHNTPYDYFSLGLLIAYNLFVMLSVRELILLLVRQKNWSLEWFPLLMSLYLLGNISAILIVQFRLGGNLLYGDLFLLIAAISFILYGFRNKFTYIRRFGLGLSLFTTTKLFLFDLSYMNTIRKILAYFCFGLILLGISYIYQKLEKNMNQQNSGGNGLAEKI